MDTATVEFNLRLTRSAATHTGACATDLTTGLTGHRLAPTAQPREQILKLREFDLRLTLTARGVLAENIKDDGRAVNDLDPHHVFECSSLAWRKLRVGDDRIGSRRRYDVL